MQAKAKLWTPSFISVGLANFLLFFSFYLLIPTLPFYLMNHFHVTNAQAGLIISGYIVCALIIRPFSAFLADTFDRKTVYFISFVLFIAFFAGYVAAASVALFAVLRAIHGFAFGAVTTTSNTVVIDILPISRQGEGIGYFGLSSTIAMAIGPIAGLFLYERFEFQYIFYAALASGAIGCLFAYCVKVPKKEEPASKEPISLDRFILPKGLPIGINFLLLGIPYGMITTYIAMYGKFVGVAGGSGLFFVVLAAGLLISRLFAGKHVDKGRMIEIIKIGSFMAAITLFGLFFVDKIPSINSFLYYSSGVLIGLSYGMMFPSFNVMFVNLAEHNRRATANSTFLTSWDLGIALGVIIGGRIIDLSKISTIYAVGAAVALISAIYFSAVSSKYFKKNRLR